MKSELQELKTSTSNTNTSSQTSTSWISTYIDDSGHLSKIKWRSFPSPTDSWANLEYEMYYSLRLKSETARRELCGKM